ncbi:hypothetical protein QTP88_018465 [Uroleucon formosanum]
MQSSQTDPIPETRSTTLWPSEDRLTRWSKVSLAVPTESRRFVKTYLSPDCYRKSQDVGGHGLCRALRTYIGTFHNERMTGF